jgi:hypothetical protein
VEIPMLRRASGDESSLLLSLKLWSTIFVDYIYLIIYCFYTYINQLYREKEKEERVNFREKVKGKR